VASIDVSRVWPKIFMSTDYTKTLAVSTHYLWGKVRAGGDKDKQERDILAGSLQPIN